MTRKNASLPTTSNVVGKEAFDLGACVAGQ